MKLIFSLFIGFISIIVIPTSVEAETPFRICDSNSVYSGFKDPSYIIPDGSYDGSTTNSKRYDITYVGMAGDRLIIHGWVINPNFDNDLGGTTTKDKTSDDTYVDLALFPLGGGDAIAFDEVIYAKEGDGNCSFSGCGNYRPKYYDFTYWHCLRTAATIDYDGYPNTCLSSKTTYLFGGFAAYIDLNKIPEDSGAITYEVRLKWTPPEGKYVNPKDTEWASIGAATVVADESVLNYNGTSDKTINIKNFTDVVTFESDWVRLIGSDGSFCSSPVLKENRRSNTYYLPGGKYTIDTATPIASGCRGGDVICGATGNGKVLLYPLKISQSAISNGSSKIGPGTGAIGYATATWLKFENNIRIVVKGEPVEPTDCPDEVEQAVCSSDGSGTQAVFHEDDRLKTCTIGENNSSGFAIERNQFCTVACKEDLDIYFPTGKATAAGQYFVLDNYKPKITAKRTCVAEKMMYDSFEGKLETKEEGLKKAYNYWQDYIKYYEEVVLQAEYSATEYKTSPPKCCDGSIDCESPTPGCSYTYEPWTIDAYTGPNGNSWAKEEGKVGDCDCDPCTGNKTACNSETLEAAQNRIKGEVLSARSAYGSALEEYKNFINKFNSCYSWMDEVYYVSVESKGSDYNSEFELTSEDGYLVNTKYSFNPKVAFDYEDQDNIFINEFSTYDMKGFDAVRSYWQKGSDAGEKYEGGSSLDGYGGIGLNRVTRDLLNCEDVTCTDTLNVSNEFYDFAHLKRVEDVEYTYKLPQVYTIIPSGVVSLNPDAGKTTLELEEYAVPVSINTPEGTYYYSITISNLKDRLRKEKETMNPDDNWDDRFVDENNPVLNGENMDEGRFSYQDYVCTYDVINDIYIPDPSKYNFFYRTVDMSNLNPTGRQLGYNWSDLRGATVEQRMAESDADYQVLTNSGDRDKFEFTLTPTLMKSIREYNSTVTNGYSDWDLKCYDYSDAVGEYQGYHCYSNFLTCLTSSGYVDETGRCSEFLRDSLSNYEEISNYVYDDLKDNREILINKQNALDASAGRG